MQASKHNPRTLVELVKFRLLIVIGPGRVGVGHSLQPFAAAAGGGGGGAFAGGGLASNLGTGTARGWGLNHEGVMEGERMGTLPLAV